MAKTSMIERDLKRRKMAKKYASRRARLKEIASDKSIPAEERFAARLKLADLPETENVSRGTARTDVAGSRARNDKIELVGIRT